MAKTPFNFFNPAAFKEKITEFSTLEGRKPTQEIKVMFDENLKAKLRQPNEEIRKFSHESDDKFKKIYNSLLHKIENNEKGSFDETDTL